MEKEMATHSSIPAWRIPWTEEPGGLQSTGSQRVGHDWATSLTHSLSQYRPVDIYTVSYTARDPAICNSTWHPPNLAAEHLDILHPGYLLFESRIRRIILSTAALRRMGVCQSTGNGHTAALPSYLPCLHPPTRSGFSLPESVEDAFANFTPELHVAASSGSLARSHLPSSWQDLLLLPSWNTLLFVSCLQSQPVLISF